MFFIILAFSKEIVLSFIASEITEVGRMLLLILIFSPLLFLKVLRLSIANSSTLILILEA